MSFELPDLAKVAAVFGTLGVAASAEGQAVVVSRRSEAHFAYATTGVPIDYQGFGDPSGAASPVGGGSQVNSLGNYVGGGVALNIQSGMNWVSLGSTEYGFNLMAAGVRSTSQSIYQSPFYPTDRFARLETYSAIDAIAREPFVNSFVSVRAVGDVSFTIMTPSRLTLEQTIDSYLLVEGTTARPSYRRELSLIRIADQSSVFPPIIDTWPEHSQRLVATSLVIPAGSYRVSDVVRMDQTFPGAGHSNGWSGSVTVLSAKTSCLADIASQGGGAVADGRVTVDDLIAYLGAFVSGNLNVADVASVGGAAGSDRSLSADDLVKYLSWYFTGCD